MYITPITKAAEVHYSVRCNGQDSIEREWRYFSRDQALIGRGKLARELTKIILDEENADIQKIEGPVDDLLSLKYEGIRIQIAKKGKYHLTVQVQARKTKVDDNTISELKVNITKNSGYQGVEDINNVRLVQRMKEKLENYESSFHQID